MSRRLDTTSWLLRSRSGGAGSSSSNMAAQNAAGAAGSSNDVVDLSAQTQIILGVVIGSVVLIASMCKAFPCMPSLPLHIWIRFCRAANCTLHYDLDRS